MCFNQKLVCEKCTLYKSAYFPQMAQYKHKVFEEETSSMGSVHLTEGVTASSTHIRFYAVRLFTI